MRETCCKPISSVQTQSRIFRLLVSGMDLARVNWLRRAAECMQLIYLVPPAPKSRCTWLGTEVPFSFRHGSKKFSCSFLLTKVIFFRAQNPLFAICSQANGTVSKGKAAAESGPSIVIWQQWLHSHIKLKWWWFPSTDNAIQYYILVLLRQSFRILMMLFMWW